MEWWEGKTHTQEMHERINRSHYPGTRQLCSKCEEPTGFCEEDGYRSIQKEFDGLPLCKDCSLAEEAAILEEPHP